MKRLLKLILISGLFFITNVFAYYESIEFSDEGGDFCCDANYLKGLYFGINGGYSWFDFSLHRPEAPLIEPLHRSRIRLREWVPIVAVGYDVYPRRKIPLRIEVNVAYNDREILFDPLFEPPFGPGIFSTDSFRVYNAMATVYLDLHTCTRFVPFLGISAGRAQFKLKHDPQVHGEPRIDRNFTNRKGNFSYGGTLGTRFFFTNHFVGNVQLRFNDLKRLRFKNTEAALPSDVDYSSDYFHETTLMIGIAYLL